MRVVIIGTGKIGCGYLAPLFAAAGWEVVLAGRSADTVARIARAGRFTVRQTGGGAQEVPVARAVRTGTPEFSAAVAAADLVCVSVGVGAVAGVAPALADALTRRPADRPLDVWVVENEDCGPELARRVHAEVQGGPLPPLGFASAVAHVAVARGSWSEQERPEFVGDRARRLYVAAAPLVTPLPALPGVHGTPDLPARLREKLYVFNAGHAICAYLGWLRGHATIAETATDPFLRPMVAGCLLESRRAVLAAHPGLGTDLHGPVAEALERYADAELADPVVRVARDPLRKLGPRDRLIGAATLVREHTGDVPPYFSLGVAGALLYRGDEAEQTRALRERLGREGVRAVLEQVCGLSVGDPFREAIATRYAGFILLPDETLFPPVYATGGAAGAVGLPPGVPA